VSLLTALQDAAEAVSLPRPAQIIGATSESERLLWMVAKREALALARRHDWPELTSEHSWTAAATETQSGGKPSDYDRMITNSFFNRTSDKRVVGPIKPADWQQLRATAAAPLLTDLFRWRGGSLLMWPTPRAGDTLAYEYVSRNLVVATDGTTYRPVWTVDTDSLRIDEELLTLGVVWRWKQQKGLAFDDDMALYESRLESAIIASRGASALFLGGDADGYALTQPTVPDGNWGL
jgi:hypothetical protein